MTGGYLVLDPQYSGCVVSVDSRFYTTISSDISINTDNTDKIHVKVESPQFINANWTFELNLQTMELTTTSATRNIFVETGLFYTLLFISGMNPTCIRKRNSLQIVIRGDNEFYSQTLENPKKFESLGCEISQVHKTGLGSSAAMITSLVGSLLVFFDICDVNSLQGKQWIHHLSQFCHCLAQGKIGSGFDVSCAVYGSHIYRRFSPQILQDSLSKAKQLSAKELVSLITQTQWDNSIEPIQLPKGLHLVLGDVDSGSNTPKLVSGVLKWRTEFPIEANTLWTELDMLNNSFLAEMKALQSYQEMPHYESVMELCSQTKIRNISMEEIKNNKILEHVYHIYDLFEQIRNCLRDMSVKSHVPIEPNEQTKLLDSCLSIPGVLVAGIPGGLFILYKLIL